MKTDREKELQRVYLYSVATDGILFAYRFD